jgi:hypothetical protein
MLNHHKCLFKFIMKFYILNSTKLLDYLYIDIDIRTIIVYTQLLRALRQQQQRRQYRYLFGWTKKATTIEQRIIIDVDVSIYWQLIRENYIHRSRIVYTVRTQHQPYIVSRVQATTTFDIGTGQRKWRVTDARAHRRCYM